MTQHINISAERRQALYEDCHACTKDFLLAAINEAVTQKGMAAISKKAAGYLSQDILADIALGLIVATNTCDNNGLHYWVDPKGYYKISID